MANQAFRTLTPLEFSNLTLQEQRDYQVTEADNIYQRIIAGESVTQSEQDFAQRILLKKIPDAPTPTGFANVAQEMTDIGTGLENLAGKVAGAQWKLWLPWMVGGLIVLAILYFWKKN